MTRSKGAVAFGAGAVGVAGIALGRRIRAVRPIAPDLRSPALMVVLPPVGRATLPAWRRLLGVATLVADGVRVDARTVSAGNHETQVVIYDPLARTGPSGALLWVHGGGLVIGCPEKENDECSRIASELGVVVVSVRYRLAPEHPFPAALDDCHTALRWLHSKAADLRVDPARIAVGGASAGGGIAAALCQLAHDAGTVPIAFQLLRYPMLDDRTVDRRQRAGRDRLAWTPASNRFGWASYLGQQGAQATAPPYAVPARREDLSGLPPAWIGVGDLDLFHDEAVQYAVRLEADGVPCELVVVPGMYHGADVVRTTAPTVLRFRNQLTRALGAYLCPPKKTA